MNTEGESQAGQESFFVIFTARDATFGRGQNEPPARSMTGGEKSILPPNHGFTVWRSEETTSVR